MNIVTRFRVKYTNLLKDTQIPLMQSRVRILTFGLLLLMGLTLIILLSSLVRAPLATIIRLLFLFVALSGSFYILIEKGKWYEAGHLMLIALCTLIWSNLVIYNFGINLVTFQVTLIIISASFYVLGKNWGIFYSLITVLPIVARLMFTRLQGGKVHITAAQLNSNPFMLALVVNFGILIIMHYEFFKSFYKSQRAEKELNAQLKSALKEAQEATRLRADFLSSMSHELRTPLHAVIGMINVLSIENPRKDQEENLAILRFSAENLLALINDTLDFSKMNADKVVLNKVSFNLNHLLNNIYTSFSAKAEQKGIELRLVTDFTDTDLHILGDQTRLTQILNNLISNAVKFTDSGGLVAVNISKQQDVEKQVTLRFSVKDTGIGIPKNKQVIIFEPFLQANNNITQRYGGTGLGLAIVKKLIDLHNSTLN